MTLLKSSSPFLLSRTNCGTDSLINFRRTSSSISGPFSMQYRLAIMSNRSSSYQKRKKRKRKVKNEVQKGNVLSSMCFFHNNDDDNNNNNNIQGIIFCLSYPVYLAAYIFSSQYPTDNLVVNQICGHPIVVWINHRLKQIFTQVKAPNVGIISIFCPCVLLG